MPVAYWRRGRAENTSRPRGIALAAKVFGVDRIKQAALTPEDKQQIFVENGRRLFEAKGGK
jgi:hypothetical protein